MYFKKIKSLVSYYLMLFVIISLLSSCSKEEIIIAEQRHNLILVNKYHYDLNDTLIANILFCDAYSDEYFLNVRFIETAPDTFCSVDQLLTKVNYDQIILNFDDDIDLICRRYNIPQFVNNDNRDLELFITCGYAKIENLQVVDVTDATAKVLFEIYDEGDTEFGSAEVKIQYFDTITSKYVDYGVFPATTTQPNKYLSNISNLLSNTDYVAKIVINTEGEKYDIHPTVSFTTE